jgi:hypothetical protein
MENILSMMALKSFTSSLVSGAGVGPKKDKNFENIMKKVGAYYKSRV